MSLTRILTILLKDLRDAIRDARVLFALLLPLGIGVFYNLTFDDSVDQLVEATLVYASPDTTRLPSLIAQNLAGVVELTVTRLPAEAEVVQQVEGDDADIGLILPAGFDRDVAAGAAPELRVVAPPETTAGGDYVQATLDSALRQLAGAADPARIVVTATGTAEDESLLDRIGPRQWAVMASLVMMLTMIAMLAVPIVLAEEAEKRTLEALTMIASSAEVIVGKALLGVVYAAVMVPALLLITGVAIHDWPLFVVTTVLITVALIGFGLLMAGLFRNANQLNTWAGIVLLPFILPAFAVGTPLPDWARLLVERLPTGEAAKLFLNAATGEAIFRGEGLSLLVIALWAVLAYGLLLARLSRAQA
jgi:ABC-2 type transport system permease protein